MSCRRIAFKMLLSTTCTPFLSRFRAMCAMILTWFLLPNFLPWAAGTRVLLDMRSPVGQEAAEQLPHVPRGGVPHQEDAQLGGGLRKEREYHLKSILSAASIVSVLFRVLGSHVSSVWFFLQCLLDPIRTFLFGVDLLLSASVPRRRR